MMKRILSLLMALVMVVGMLPVNALAADDEPEESTVAQEAAEETAVPEETEPEPEAEAAAQEPSEPETEVPQAEETEEAAPAEEETEVRPSEEAASAEPESTPVPECYEVEKYTENYLWVGGTESILDYEAVSIYMWDVDMSESKNYIAFTDWKDSAYRCTIQDLNGNTEPLHQYYAPLSESYRLTDNPQDWERDNPLSFFDFTGCYAYLVTHIEIVEGYENEWNELYVIRDISQPGVRPMRETFRIDMGNLSWIGGGDDDDVYYWEGEMESCVTEIDVVDLYEVMRHGTLTNLAGDIVLPGTTAAPKTEGFRVASLDMELNEEYEGFDFGGCYVLVYHTENDDTYYCVFRDQSMSWENPAQKELNARVDEAIHGAQEYLIQQYPDGFTANDAWVVFTLARTGYALTEAQKNSYLKSVAEVYLADTVKTVNLQPTTLARTILALTALGVDATDFGGFNFVRTIMNDRNLGMASNFLIWAQLASKCHYTYRWLENLKWNEDTIIQKLITFQNADGGFGLVNSNHDGTADLTAMALTAIGCADNFFDYADCSEKALAFLSGIADEHYGFSTSESDAQVIVGLLELARDPAYEMGSSLDNNVVVDLLSYRDSTTGRFLHVSDPTKGDLTLATYQALYALYYYRNWNTEGRLYNIYIDELEPYVYVEEEVPGPAPEIDGDTLKLSVDSGIAIGEDIRLVTVDLPETVKQVHFMDGKTAFPGCIIIDPHGDLLPGQDTAPLNRYYRIDAVDSDWKLSDAYKAYDFACSYYYKLQGIGPEGGSSRILIIQDTDGSPVSVFPDVSGDTLLLPQRDLHMGCIGEDSDQEHVYYVNMPIPDDVTKVSFTDLEDRMEDGIIISQGAAFAEGTHIVPLSKGYYMTETPDDWTYYDKTASYDFTDSYLYIVTDSEGELFYAVIRDADGIHEPPLVVPDPVVTAHGNVLSAVRVTEGGYRYTDYLGQATKVKLLTYTLPYGVTDVQIDFGMELIAYNYGAADASDSDYISGWLEDPESGATSAKYSVDANEDGKPDYIQVQTPYDEAWNSELLYAITFEFTSAPKITAQGYEIGTGVVKDGYRYTNYLGQTATVDVFTAQLPYGTRNAEITFGANVLAYNYKESNTSDDGYLYGEYMDYMTGVDAVIVPVDANNDGILDYVQVQTPYYDGWHSDLLYAISFAETDPPTISAHGCSENAIEVLRGGYSYTDYLGRTTVADLLTVHVPYGTTEAVLFLDRNSLAYNYAKQHSTDDDYLAGEIEDFMTGMDTFTVQLDANKDGKIDYIQVQSPYDASWNSSLRYAVTFVQDELAQVSTEDEVLSGTVTKGGYRYTNYKGETSTVDLYTVNVPFGAAQVRLQFPRNVLAYNYGSADSTDDDYVAGAMEDFLHGESSFTVDVDADGNGELDYIQVQSPYDADWNSEVHYAIAFRYCGTIPGGSKLTLTAPSDLGAVTWSVRTRDAAIASVSAKGVLTAKAVSEPTLIVVTAVSKADPEKTVSFPYSVLPTAYRAHVWADGYDADIRTIYVELPALSTETVALKASVEPIAASAKGTWKSSNAKIASVDEKGVVTVKKAGTVKITFTAADSAKATDFITITAGVPAKVSLNMSAAELPSGKKLTLKAAVNADATVKTITWISSDPSAATVSKGVVTAKTVYVPTIVRITAQTADGHGSSAECEVTVMPKSGTLGIFLGKDCVSGKTITVDIRKSVSLTAEEENVTWASSSAKIAEVDKMGNVTFKKAGTVTVTAGFVDESGKKCAAKVTLKGVRMADTLTVAASSDAPLVSGKGAVNVTANIDSDATERSVIWHGGEGLVKITSTGKNTAKVTALKNLYAPVDAYIWAEMKDGSGVRSEMLQISIVPAAESVTLTAPDGLTAVTAAIEADEPLQGRTLMVDIETAPEISLAALVSARSGADEISQTVTWKTSSKKIAEVDASGKVTIRTTGSVTITATAADGSRKAASVKLNVVRLAKSIEAAVAAPLVSGKSVTLKPVLKPAEEGAKLTSKAVTFALRDADKEFASVNSKGIVTAKKGLTEEHRIVVTVALKENPAVSVDVDITVVPKI